MNITREKLSDLELCIKVDIEENDYIENVNKQLKEYQHKATIPGFRKGMAPKGLIERMYKPAIVGDAVQNTLNTSLFKYIDDEKLHILGMPMSNDEKTGEVDFAKGTSFTFYFDVAVAPEFEIAWDKVDVKYNQLKVTAKDVDAELNNVVNRYGKFETPETVAAGDIMYGKVVELDKKGAPKEGGVETFVSLNLLNLKDAELMPLFEGKKAEDKIVFNMAKAFPTADIERALHIDNAAAKKFKSDVELTLSGISRIIPHEINDELYQMVFPGQTVKDEAAFRKLLQKEIEKANAAGIPIIRINRDISGGKFVSSVSDDREAGRMQGEFMAKNLPQGAKIVYMNGEMTQSGAKKRWEGFKEACLDKRPDIQLLASADCSWNEAVALRQMSLWLKLFPQIDGVVGANDDMALGAIRALRDAGRLEGVLVSGVDATDAALKAVSDGTMSQTVKQDADKTAEAIAGLLQKSLSGTAPTDDVKVPFTEITRDNISQFR